MKYTWKSSLAVVITASLAACSSGNSTEQPAVQPTNTKDSKETVTAPKQTYKIFRNFGSPEYPADGGRGKKKY